MVFLDLTKEIEYITMLKIRKCTAYSVIINTEICAENRSLRRFSAKTDIF